MKAIFNFKSYLTRLRGLMPNLSRRSVVTQSSPSGLHRTRLHRTLTMLLLLLCLGVGNARGADEILLSSTDSVLQTIEYSNVQTTTNSDTYMLWAQLIITFLTLLSVLIALFQFYKSNKRNRAEFIVKLYNEYINDNDMVDMFYQIEYGEFKYNGSFHDSEDEKKIDKLLGHFDNICRLYHMKELTRADISFMEYQIRRVANNSQVLKYLSFLDSWFKRVGENTIKYADLRQFTSNNKTSKI